MKLDLRKRWKKAWTAIGRRWHDATHWLGRQRWLRQPLQQLRRLPAAGPAIMRQLRRVPDAMRPLLRPLRRVADAMRSLLRPLGRIGGALRRLPTRLKDAVQPLLRHLGRVGGALRRLPTQLKGALLWLARLRPNTRFWSVVAGLLTVPLGAFLIVTPVRELATGQELDLRSLLTATWLLTGFATVTAGLGMLFRAPSFRPLLWLALVCSLPLPAAFGYRTYTLMVKKQVSDEATQHTLQPWIDGGIQLTLLFLGLSAYLGTMLWLRPLRRLQCTTPLLRGRAGVLLAPCYGSAFGIAVGYSLWQGLRHGAERESLKFLLPVLGFVRLEYFACACGAVGAAWLARSWWRRRTGAVARTSPPVQRTAPPPAASPPARPAVSAPLPPRQPATTQPSPTQVRRPQPAGSMPSRP